MHRRLSVSGAPTSGRLLLLLPAITAESSVAKRFNFPRIQQPFDDGMNASQKILLRRQTKGFNSPFDFSRGQPFLSAHEDGADGVCNAINKACGSAGFLVFVGKFGESGDLPLLFRNLFLQKFALNHQKLEEVCGFFQFEFVMFGHDRTLSGSVAKCQQ